MGGPRSSAFHPSRQPLKNLPGFRPAAANGTTGPFRALNPTQHRIVHAALHSDTGGDGDDGTARSDRFDGDNTDAASDEKERKPRPPRRSETTPADAVTFKWTSRNNRKGRHLLEFTPAADPANARYEVPESSSAPRQVARGIWRMFTVYPVWDISWLVAYIFTWGSIIWVINSLYAPVPPSAPTAVVTAKTASRGSRCKTRAR